MPTRRRGRDLSVTSHSSTTQTTADDAVLAHERPQGAASLRRAGDGCVEGQFSFSIPPPPQVRCPCDVCLKASSRSIHQATPGRTACESLRRQRARDLLGHKRPTMSPGSGYRLAEIARYLEIDRVALYRTALQLKLLRKADGDQRYLPLTRTQTKTLIQHCRAR
jgi:hypothetical protein